MDAMREMLAKRKKGMRYAGIPSFCTASDLVIEACLKQAIRFDDYVLIEATANQVNQFGGYTGMKPADYRDFVYKIADEVLEGGAFVRRPVFNFMIKYLAPVFVLVILGSSIANAFGWISM